MLITKRQSRLIDLDLSPFEVASRARHLPGMVFFDTAMEKEGGGEISIVAAVPSLVVEGSSDGDWARLSEALAVRAEERGIEEGIPGGMAAGFVEYGGKFRFGFYDDLLIYRHGDRSWEEVGNLRSRLAEGGAGVTGKRRPGLVFSAETSEGEFCEWVRRAQGYISAGDIYQVNLAHRLSAVWEGDPWVFYEALRRYSPAPHAAYLALAERQILSSSPEHFLKMSGGAVRTRPIKGTRPRRAEVEADSLSADDLCSSAKEAAELIMITDLERNDLGQVCEYGSVSVRELLKLERFEQVFHLVSTVEGRLRSGVDQVAALRACFPGGSITGAPKKRAREIIGEIEPSERGVYTGALGWFGFNGESQFSIAIRTAVVEGGRVHFHVGAGIVADSVPEAEWQETLDKAAGILLAGEKMGDAVAGDYLGSEAGPRSVLA